MRDLNKGELEFVSGGAHVSDNASEQGKESARNRSPVAARARDDEPGNPTVTTS